METAETTIASGHNGGAVSMSPPAPCSAPPMSDDDILSLWYTVQPSPDQHKAMTYESGPYDVTFPTWELRRLVELAIEYTQNDSGLLRQAQEGASK